jgi:hypothetical protein
VRIVAGNRVKIFWQKLDSRMKPIPENKVQEFDGEMISLPIEVVSKIINL